MLDGPLFGDESAPFEDAIPSSLVEKKNAISSVEDWCSPSVPAVFLISLAEKSQIEGDEQKWKEGILQGLRTNVSVSSNPSWNEYVERILWSSSESCRSLTVMAFLLEAIISPPGHNTP